MNITKDDPDDMRGISDPPDMGRLRPAEEVAKEFVDADGDILDPNGCLAFRDGRNVIARLIRKSRAEGAAAALEAAADHLDEDLGYTVAADVLRARAKGVSDPPDMG